MAHVVEHLTVAELEQRYRTTCDGCRARHYQMIWLLAQGHTIVDVSALTGFVPRWIEELLSRYNLRGDAALGDLRRHNGARPSLLTADLLDRLQVRLRQPPPDGGVWSCRKVAAWIADDLCLESVGVQRGREALRAIGWSLKAPRPRNSDGARQDQQAAYKKLGQIVAEEAAAHPGTRVEVWASDEHRIGLKPIQRRVWTPVGERPIALGRHRFQWLFVTAFVSPASGEVVWFLSNRLDKPFFAALLAEFAREVGAGGERIIVLQIDNAGWHTPENLAVPPGIRLVYQPRYTPELQPAEHLWRLVDEPIVNTHIASLEQLEVIVATRCCDLADDPATIASTASFNG